MRLIALAAIAACILATPVEARRHDGATGLIASYCGDQACSTFDVRQIRREYGPMAPKKNRRPARSGTVLKSPPSKSFEKVDLVPLPRSRPLHPFAWLASEPDPVVFATVSVAQFGLEVRQRLLEAAAAALGRGPAALGTRSSLWCADFINRTLAKLGLRGTGSALASSFARWGRPAPGPCVGCVAVKPRSGGNHVVIIKEVHGRELVAISGNSGGKVRLLRYRVAQFYAFRVPDVVMR